MIFFETKFVLHSSFPWCCFKLNISLLGCRQAHKETLVSQTQLSSRNSTEGQLPGWQGCSSGEMVPDSSLGLAAHRVIANLASCSGCFSRTPSQVQHSGTSLEVPPLPLLWPRPEALHTITLSAWPKRRHCCLSLGHQLLVKQHLHQLLKLELHR